MKVNEPINSKLKQFKVPNSDYQVIKILVNTVNLLDSINNINHQYILIDKREDLEAFLFKEKLFIVSKFQMLISSLDNKKLFENFINSD
jgi:hypothetical protein